jgi:hypothetical protein
MYMIFKEKSHKAVGINVYLTFFLLSDRRIQIRSRIRIHTSHWPKNMWIRWIRIRIRNTGKYHGESKTQPPEVGMGRAGQGKKVWRVGAVLFNTPVVTVVQTDYRERVVQISRRERINGEDALRPEVAAPRHFRWRNGPGGVVRGQVSQHFLPEFREIHVVFQQQRFRSHCNVRAIPYAKRGKEL